MRTRYLTAEKLKRELEAATAEPRMNMHTATLIEVAHSLLEALHTGQGTPQDVANAWVAEQRKYPVRRYIFFDGVFSFRARRRVRPIVTTTDRKERR